MRIANTVVNTPFLELGDNVMCVSGDWVHMIARALADGALTAKSLPAPIRSSPEYRVIEAHVTFLTTPEPTAYAKASHALRMHKVVTSWAEKSDGPRVYLDAMLLGGKPYKDIATRIDDGRASKKDMLELVCLYETLFMHCRRSDGALLPKLQLHALALDGRPTVTAADPEHVHWRVKAATQGIAAVEPLWGDAPEDLDAYTDGSLQSIRLLVHNELEMRSRTGAGYTKDFISTASLMEDIEKRKSDERIASTSPDSSESSAVRALEAILAINAPERVAVEDYAQNTKETTKADKRSLASSKKISKTAVSDRGPAGALAAMDAAVKKHVAKVATKQEKPKK